MRTYRSEPRWQHIKFLRLGSSAEVAAFTRTFKDELQAQIDARDNNALTANVLYGVGLVGLGTGVVLWLMAPDDARAVPSVGLTPDGGVFLWSGSF